MAGSPPTKTWRIDEAAGVLHHPAQVQRVGRRAQQDGRLEPADHVRPGAGVHAAAGQDRQAHLGQRHLHAPGEDMRAVAGDHEHRVAVPEVHRVQRPRVGPGPLLAVDVAVAEHARRAGRAGRGEPHPAALRPDRVVHRRVGAVGRMFDGVGGHLVLVQHRPLRDEVID
jgi:hypothetical protein